MRLTLNTLENTRKTLSRIIRKYNAGEIEDVKFRNLVYAFSHLLGYWRTEKDLEIEERLTKLEEKLYEERDL
jgi:hypothetical protein